MNTNEHKGESEKGWRGLPPLFLAHVFVAIGVPLLGINFRECQVVVAGAGFDGMTVPHSGHLLPGAWARRS